MKLNTVKKQDEAVENAYIPEVETVEEPVEDLSGLSLDEKIIYWKNKYKRIFKCSIGGQTYIFRRINRKEYTKIAFTKPQENISKQEEMYNKQYEFCKVAVLYPDNVADILDDCAGISPTLGDEIIFNSGFGDIYTKTKEITEDDNETEED